jgi:hypothetical protein
VVDLNAAKAQGVAEHREYVAQVTDLCTLARSPEKVGAFIRDNTPVAQVRKALLEVSAEHIRSQHGLTPPAVDAWGKITDKLNASVK